MFGLHLIDYVVIAAYFIIVLTLGKIGTKKITTGDDYFLAGRKLGKFYQFFLNFGHGVSASDSVSTVSVIYRQGVSGVWVSLQMIFLNPYYWFLYVWFRRVRLTTTGDLFLDRLGSRNLALFFASFQIVMAVAVTMGYGNLVSYKIASALVTKPEARWTVEERRSVEDYREMQQLEAAKQQAPLLTETEARLQVLRERQTRGELMNHVTALNPWYFYIAYISAVGVYIIMGGLSAAAINEVFQGVLIVVFSVILIPAGMAAIGGWGNMGQAIPADMFNLFGSNMSSHFSGWAIAAVFFATLLQGHAGISNMAVAGSAKNEFAARFGAASGNYGKRILTVMWAFCGLIAVGMFAGTDSLSDSDKVWGVMSRQLLGPGLLGLMFAGVLAANMSTIAAQSMSISALFSRNVYGTFRPGATDADLVRIGRWTIVFALMGGIIIATMLSDVYIVLQFAMTINVPFGAAILLMFIWRKVTVKGVWIAVIGSALVNILFPLAAQKIPALYTNPTLVSRTADEAGRPVPVFFESVVRTNPADLQSPLEGRGRLHTELVVLHAVGMDVVGMTSSGRFAGRFFIDALTPLVLLIVASLLTRPPEKERVDQFFGKMKTPVGATPALEAEAMEETRRNPRRFDGTKLFPSSSWEWTRWTAVDAVGFVICCGVTLSIIAIFWFLLKLAAG